MLQTRKYNWMDIFIIPFQLSPVYLIIYFLLELIQALLSTIGLVFATSYFVDEAKIVLSRGATVSRLYLALGLLLVVFVFSGLIDQLLGLLLSRLKIEMERQLLPEILNRTASLKYKYIEHSETLDLIERISKNIILNLQEGVRGLTMIIRSIVALASVLLLIVTYVWWSAVLITVVSIPLFIFSIKAGGKNYSAWMEAAQYERRYSYYSDDILTSRMATPERKLFGYAEKIVKLHRKFFELARKIQERVSVEIRLTLITMSIVITAIALLISFSLINPVIDGTISPGLFMGINTAVFTMATTFGTTMQEATKQLSYANSCMNDLTEFMSLKIEGGAKDLPEKQLPVFKSLVFKNVSFKYPNSNYYSLEKLSFTIDADTHYAFVGKNGSGKTTIIKLMTGLYDEYDGEIFINGIELRQIPQSTLKAMFSVSYQDFAKYQVSLFDNIALGNTAKGIQNDELENVIEKTQLSEMVQQLKEGAHTLLGKISKEGTDLSGGQWQKIAISRTLISPAPIKILDEPTASLDPMAESIIYKEFEEVMKGKTTIFISHRLGSTKLAEKILVMDEGKLIESGSHQTLLDKEGVYAAMFEAQRRWYE
ncbi:ABC transporter ATP-binding protein [Tuanshanicoccus lijuaniae]|uniref:ABC transporter ATP-binding protein n=1 Tax=Aerococcaceae bacterium zg-1292 TaxID=2774330 RepID=UPI001BD8F69E|nr:ABC transporter ATP-binding protein [Aerococcaceae bacterium zg-A91]MBS4457179.1 ABC transporter ATP-binding protein [Aerococcaceae bacterium zg-BR33]